MSTTTFTAVITVAVPVTDQDRTKALLEQLGFETRMDAELQEGFRWVELGLAGLATTISLVRAGDELSAGVDTGIRLATSDARTAPRDARRTGSRGRCAGALRRHVACKSDGQESLIR